MYKLLCFMFILFSISTYGVDDLNIKLKENEKEWIQENKEKEITIYLDRDRGILNYNTDGKNKGIFPNVINLLSKKTGLKFRIINEKTEEFERSVDLGVPDIVMGIEDYKRNSKEYNYIDQHVELDGVMITRKDYPTIDFKEDNFGKKIIYEEEDEIRNKIIKKYGNLVTLIPKPTLKEAIEALLSKDGDIYIDDYQDALKYLIENPNNNVKFNYLSNELKTEYYIGGKENFKPLMDIIDRIFANKDLTMQFFHEEVLNYTKNKLEISIEIEKYIKNKENIRVVLPLFEEFPQLYYTDEKNITEGFLKNYFNEISKILGVKIEFERKKLDQNFDVDPFILSVNGDELISENKELLITEPYTQMPLLIFNRRDQGYIPYFENLKKYKIAVVKDSFIETYLLYKGLGNNLVRLENIKEVLEAVNSKKADILIGELQQVNYFLELYGIKKLAVAGTIQDKLELSFGVSKEDKVLYYLVNSLNNKFSYKIKAEKSKFFAQKIDVAKDYKLSLGILIVSIFLLSLIYSHLKKFKKTSLKLKDLTIALVGTLENANKFNDEDTGAHIKRLNFYSELMARELQMPKSFIDEIGIYASLHDIGKIGIPDNILKKPGKLTKEEFEKMKKHVEIGYNLMKDLNISQVAINIVRYHHEKWDGSGYGQGLKGEEIPIEARIVALVDVYDALRQKRVYKDAFSHEKSIGIIVSQSGKHFDPKLVEIFIKKQEEFKRIFEEK